MHKAQTWKDTSLKTNDPFCLPPGVQCIDFLRYVDIFSKEIKDETIPPYNIAFILDILQPDNDLDSEEEIFENKVEKRMEITVQYFLGCDRLTGESGWMAGICHQVLLQVQTDLQFYPS